MHHTVRSSGHGRLRAPYHGRRADAEAFAQPSPLPSLRYPATVKVTMNRRQPRLDALRSLQELETGSVYGWVLSTDVPPSLQQSLQTAAAQGLAELADRKSARNCPTERGARCRGRPLSTPRATQRTRLPASRPRPHSPSTPADGEPVVELRPSRRDTLRVYVNVAPVLRQPTAASGLCPVTAGPRTSQISGTNSGYRTRVVFVGHSRVCEACAWARRCRLCVAPHGT